MSKRTADENLSPNEDIEAIHRSVVSDVNRVLVRGMGECGEESVPVYVTKKESLEGVKLPPNAVVVDRDSIWITDATTREVDGDARVRSLGSQVMRVSPLELFDMKPITKAAVTPSAIVVRFSSPEQIRVLFNFYKELLGRERATNEATLDAFRVARVNLANNLQYGLHTLAVRLGAKLFLRAINTAGDTSPEKAVTRMLMGASEDFSRPIPYAVVPHLESEVDKDGFVLPNELLHKGKRDRVVVIDISEGPEIGFPSFGKTPDQTQKMMGTVKKKMSLMMKKKVLDVVEPLLTIPKSVYMTFRNLYKLQPNPSGILFINTAPSAVKGLMDFYGSVITPPNTVSGCEMSPTNDLWMLSLEGMGAIKFHWIALASVIGAKEFETLMRSRG